MTNASETTKDTASSPGASPPFRRMENDLRARLSRAEWAEGSLLPSRRALAQEYGVALRTAERAISGLLADGLVRADGRWGTYVTGAAVPARPAAPHPPSALPLTATIGLLDTNSLYTHAPRRDDYGWLNVIATHAERAFAQGGGITKYFTQFGAQTERVPVRRALEKLGEDGADALLVLGIFDEDAAVREVVDALASADRPAVYVSWDDVVGEVPHVFYDNRIAGGQAVQHLRRSGYGEVIYFAPYAAAWAEERLTGARQASDKGVHVYPPDRDYPRTEGASDRYRRLANTLLAEYTPIAPGMSPAGIVAANDMLALVVLDAAADAGLTPGRDFGLVGFDDDPASRLRGLTTLRPPLEALGEQAARMLLNRLRGDDTEVQVRLRSHLVPRTSTRLIRL